MDNNPLYREQVETLARTAQSLTMQMKNDPDGRAVLWRYVKYLLGEKPHSYADLADYLEWWGTTFLYKDILRVLEGRRYNKIIELGPGTGWLIRQLVPYGEKLYAIDKRSNLIRRNTSFKFIQQDMEIYHTITLPLEGTDLIIANQFFHCVTNAQEIVEKNRATWLVIEVISYPWSNQLREFGATPLTNGDVYYMFSKNRYEHIARGRVSSEVEIGLWRPK